MSIATGAMASLIPKLVQLLRDEYKLHTGVKKDVEFLEREMKSMDAALRKVAMVPHDQLDEQVKIWADDVRELSYEMEDVVDSFLVRVQGSAPVPNLDSFKGLMKKMINLFKKGKIHHQIADAIKDIRKQVQEVAARRDRYRVDDVNASSTAITTVDPRMLALFKDQREFVGIDEPRDELIKRLTEENVYVSNSNHHLKIISIFGFGGLGKTTLAKAVYDKLQQEFVRMAFVSVGQNPNLKKVFLDILRHLDENSYLNAITLDEVQLIGELRRLLEDKRYLIVIDDIWDIKSWEIITCALVDQNLGSIIITTTRILQVAKEIGYVYKQRPLSDDNSRELFFKRLSKNRDSYHQSSVEISDKILKKCGGVPLAIITIASLLASKPRENWSEVYDSVGFGHEDGDNVYVENTRKILRYSYYDLPCYLRTCLLHLSIFPEDSRIRINPLIWKWVAEGFVMDEKHSGVRLFELGGRYFNSRIRINPLIWKWVAEGFVMDEKHSGVRLFELGGRYFNELINRSMIQLVEEPNRCITYACHVHDLVLDMIHSLSKEENFAVVVGGDEQEHMSHTKSNVRRLAIQNRVIDEDDPTMTNTSMPQVRSFNATMCRLGMMPSLSRFHGLRVLALEECTFTKDRSYHLEHLGKLLQLRYLGMSDTPIKKLPSDIGNLKFLQTLNLEFTEIIEFPKSVGLLMQLMCLHLPKNFSGSFDWMRNLTSLEELWMRDVSQEFVQELGKLTELRVLWTTFNSTDADLFNDLMVSVGNLHKLRFLHVRSWHNPVEWKDCEAGYVAPRQLRHLLLDAVVFPRLPAWIDSSRLPQLTHLYLNVEAVEAQDLEILGRFPQLISLELQAGDGIEFPDVVVGGGGAAFPELRSLYVTSMVRFLQGAMPSLENLHYHCVRGNGDCESIATIGNLACLRNVQAKVACSLEGAETETALRHAVEIHPRRPVLQTYE